MSKHPPHWLQNSWEKDLRNRRWPVFLPSSIRTWSDTLHMVAKLHDTIGTKSCMLWIKYRTVDPPNELAIIHTNSVGKCLPRFKQPMWKVLEHKFSISRKSPTGLKDHLIRFLPHACYYQALWMWTNSSVSPTFSYLLWRAKNFSPMIPKIHVSMKILFLNVRNEKDFSFPYRRLAFIFYSYFIHYSQTLYIGLINCGFFFSFKLLATIWQFRSWQVRRRTSAVWNLSSPTCNPKATFVCSFITGWLETK